MQILLRSPDLNPTQISMITTSCSDLRTKILVPLLSAIVGGTIVAIVAWIVWRPPAPPTFAEEMERLNTEAEIRRLFNGR